VSIASAADLDRALAAVREVVRASPLVISDWEPAQAELYPSIVERLRRDKVPPFGAPAKAA